MAIRSGDLISFVGRDRVAAAIQLGSLGFPLVTPHHVGIVCTIHGSPVIYEAMGYSGTRGPCLRSGAVTDGFQAHLLDDVLETVTDQAIYHHPLRCELYPHEEDRLGYFLDSLIGRPYDKLGAVRSGGTLLRLLQLFIRPENLNGLFCSESVAAALVEIGRFQTKSAGAWNPAALVRTLRRSGVIEAPRRLNPCLPSDS
jgi:hypothetical protein